ncbi:nucleolar complex protein 3 [Biomphalaria pfeifferi]|uniref:Nucleolar complex protein 3 homolog n=1 Tax=Biomphalaria pfeifferi TaxID=112525 RepID=A0AAD8BGP3_BIOPF|nr:nucleolar complex protein 3 [Biomphalaria pfeifferi]
MKPKVKGKTKTSSVKVSLAKLANKRNTRLAKQGKLHKVSKKEKKRQIAQEKNEKNQKQQLASSKESQPEHAESEEESFSDEDVDCFQNFSNAKSFLQTRIEEEGEQPKRKKQKVVDDEDSDVDEGEKYERQPRSFAADVAEQKMKMMLPIIAKGKVIKRMVEKDAADEVEKPVIQMSEKADVKEHNSDDEEEVALDKKAEREKEKQLLASMSAAQLYAYRKKKLEEKKEKIASLSHAVLADPQTNIKKLKELRLMLGETDLCVSLTVRKYAMISIAEVFKDIVPGYRLRIPTEKERSQKVKKETKSLWDYETSFLLSYRVYLEFLETLAKAKPIPEKSFLTKHGIHDLQLPQKTRVELGHLALKCLCEMLVHHPHFNYRNNLIATIVPFCNHKDSQFSETACNSIKSVFQQDKSGEVTLEIVKTIGRMVKKLEFNVQPQVLETFLVLKIKEIDLSSGETFKKMKRTEKMLKLSRRERKRLKQKEKLDKELLETKASYDKKLKLKLHTEIIQAVFETYVRVIKLACDSALLPAVLEGLARFAHLINIEYFDSLFDAFNCLIESGLLTNREMLHCMQTAFTILSGQGSVINIDPTNFYKHFYCTLLSVHAASFDQTATIVLDCLDSMISKRRRQVSQQRILAFIKRLSTMCLYQTSETALALLAVLRQFVHTYKYSDILFDTEAQGSGLYLPFLEDPEHCCANSTSLWDFHLLLHHYDPEVQRYAKHMIKMAPLSGEHQLSQELSRKSPKELHEMLQGRDFFHKVPEKCPKKQKVRSTDFLDTEFGKHLGNICDSVPDLAGE